MRLMREPLGLLDGDRERLTSQGSVSHGSPGTGTAARPSHGARPADRPSRRLVLVHPDERCAGPGGYLAS